MFVGLTALALISHVHVAEDVTSLVGAPAGYVQRTVIAQIAGAVFGIGSLGFYLVQAATTLILVLAANTAFNGFPILASILAMTDTCLGSSPGVATGWCSPTAS